MVNSKLVDDVRQKKVTVVSGGRIDAVFPQEARPSERHKFSQFETLRLVVIVERGTGLFNKQARKLEEGYADTVRVRYWLLRID